jgi:hypothetical protein
MKKESEGTPKGNTPSKRNSPAAKRRWVFEGKFSAYWHFTKFLSEEQRRTLSASLSEEEQSALLADYKKGGWNHLFMRNACDQVLDDIRERFKTDWLEVRARVLKGKDILVQRGFWEYLNNRFDGVDWEHIAYIFDGLVAYDHNADYVRISLFKEQNLPEANDTKDTKGE